MRSMAIFICMLISAVYADMHAEVADTVVVSSSTRACIDFKVNITDLDISYHGNDRNLERVLTRIDSMVLNPDMRVERITVVGTASPEGPHDNNIRLASARAKEFISILQSRYLFPDSIYSISTIPGDWDGMRTMLAEDSTIPYAQIVLKFIDETKHLDPDTRQQRLRTLDKGRPFASMRDNVLPYLRRASVIVDYDTRHIRPIPQIKADSMPPTATVLPEPEIMTPTVAPATPMATARHFFAIKTNLLWDVALCANLGFEVELWPHWSLDVPVWYSPYDITDRWRIRLLATQPEVRYWPKDAGCGHYFGIHTSVIGFNVSTGGDYRYQDPNHAAFGLGIGYGYAFHLDKARRWSLEAQIGAGYISYKWNKYHNTGHNGAMVSQGKGTYWGVTRAGFTISYKFYRERKGRRWMKW